MGGEDSGRLRLPRQGLFPVHAHGTPLQRLPRDIAESLLAEDLPQEAVAELWRSYLDTIQPLKESGKLGFILAQFPPRFTPTRENARYLLSCEERLQGYNIAVEFRHEDWFEGRLCQRALDFLRENGLALVCVDMLQGFDSAISPLAEATAKEYYVRLHGRNAAVWDWQGVTVGSLRDYRYTEVELEEGLTRLRQFEEEADRVHVLFNMVQGLERGRVMQNMITKRKDLRCWDNEARALRFLQGKVEGISLLGFKSKTRMVRSSMNRAK